MTKNHDITDVHLKHDITDATPYYSSYNTNNTTSPSAKTPTLIVPKNRAVIYLRVSTQEQDPENQYQECLALAQRKGLNVIKVYKENASAWKKGNVRSQFEAMLKAGWHRDYEHIIAWDIDRIYRNCKKFLKLIQDYDRLGVKFHLVNQSYLDTLYDLPEPFDAMMYEFLIHWEAYRAQAESDKRSKRVRIAYANRKKKWGRPSHSDYVKRRIKELRADGLSLRQISKQLHISKSSVHKIITGEGL